MFVSFVATGIKPGITYNVPFPNMYVIQIALSTLFLYNRKDF